MQSEFRVIEPDVFPLHKNSAYFHTEVKDKDYVYTCFLQSISTTALPMKKKLVIYMETAAIFKIINKPNIFGNSTSQLWYPML